jgi:hypothetical protein
MIASKSNENDIRISIAADPPWAYTPLLCRVLTVRMPMPAKMDLDRSPARGLGGLSQHYSGRTVAASERFYYPKFIRTLVALQDMDVLRY